MRRTNRALGFLRVEIWQLRVRYRALKPKRGWTGLEIWVPMVVFVRRWIWRIVVLVGAACFIARLGIAWAAIFPLFAPSSVEASECVGLQKIRQSLMAANEPRTAALATQPPGTVRCASMVSVLSRLARRDTTGGRRLERDRPASAAQAQADLDAATRDPEVRGLLEQVARDTSDPNARLLYEAAILDDGGYYAARDAKIDLLRKRIE